MTNFCSLPDESSQREFQKLKEVYIAVFGEACNESGQPYLSEAEKLDAIEQEIAGLGNLVNLSEQ